RADAVKTHQVVECVVDRLIREVIDAEAMMIGFDLREQRLKSSRPHARKPADGDRPLHLGDRRCHDFRPATAKIAAETLVTARRVDHAGVLREHRLDQHIQPAPPPSPRVAAVHSTELLQNLTKSLPASRSHTQSFHWNITTLRYH